jgi:hypothetical protein
VFTKKSCIQISIVTGCALLYFAFKTFNDHALFQKDCHKCQTANAEFRHRWVDHSAKEVHAVYGAAVTSPDPENINRTRLYFPHAAKKAAYLFWVRNDDGKVEDCWIRFDHLLDDSIT